MVQIPLSPGSLDYADSPAGSAKLPPLGEHYLLTRGERVIRVTLGQTMTEYALLLAAVAVAVYSTYRLLGNNIGTLASGVDSALTNA